MTTSAHATATLYGTDATVDTSYVLQATGFGFAVPSSPTVVGVEASVKHTRTGGTSAVYDNNVTLVGVTGTPYNRAQPGTGAVQKLTTTAPPTTSGAWP